MKAVSFYISAIVALLALSAPPTSAAEVGYVNILNGQSPGEAFVVERQGRTINPTGVYTNLEEGDLVKPSPEAMLIFTPLEAACATVEIRDNFIAAACPRNESGLTEIAYDYVTNDFLAAPAESVGLYASRGAADNRSFTLPPTPLSLFSDHPETAALLKKMPSIALAQEKNMADVILQKTADGARLLDKNQTGGIDFTLPGESLALRQALSRRISFKTIASLESPGEWPDIAWLVRVYTPSPSGDLDYEGRKWALQKTVEVKGPTLPGTVPKESLLTFEIINKSSKNYHAYLVNYTDDGLLLPVLPPESQAHISNVVAAGESRPFPQLQLELSAPLEYVRLILSENPLDLSQYSQAGLDKAAALAGKVNRLRPVPENSWHTLVQTFKLP
ncbi:MAG: hypothetical protein LBP55_09105 [Candidatus Adiutrix sp.]|jgi:hypothetical protein|nr:hypothetical protein [Candidatus Adiutrix sp.]